MKIDYNKYLTKNKTDGDCQLVTACNAYTFLTGKTINQNSNLYEELIDLALCRHGAAITIEKVWKKLGIWENKRFGSIYDIKFKPYCFYELTIWHIRYGYHSVSIVEYDKRCDAVRLTNFNRVSNLDGWIFLDDLKPHIRTDISDNEPHWQLRTFKLKK